MKNLISVCLAILVVSTTVKGSRLTQCPTDWFSAQIVLTADFIVPPNLAASNQDLDLTFFREELRFTEAEIDLARQSAIDFFNTRFGLNFSQVDPNEPERRLFQNATFEPFFLTTPFTATVDRWLVTGRNRSGRCFNAREGGFVVNLIGNQVLRGTFGGDEGIVVAPGIPILAWAYYSIDACEVAPVLIQITSDVPARTTPDGIVLDSNIAFHRTLGRGSENSVNTFTPIPNSPNLQFVTRRILVFPDVLPSELITIP